MSERAASLRNYPMVMAMVLSIASFAKSAKATTPAIVLDVSHTVDPATQSALLVLNCSFDANLTDMVSVASLTLFGSKPYGNQSEFDKLVVVDIWSPTPNLTSDLEDADVVIKDKIGQENDSHSYLTISWNSPTPGYRQYYKCVANGLDRQRQAASISTTVKVEILNGGSNDSQLREVSEKVENTCTEKTAAALTVQVKNLLSKIEALDSKIDDKIEALNSKIDGKIEALESDLPSNFWVLDSKLKAFQSDLNLQIKMATIDKGNFYVSDISKDRVYLVSKTKASFNIGAANQACKSNGGYLVELDNHEEFQFVSDFLTLTGGDGPFWTGANDIEREGYFYYFNSKKQIPAWAWVPNRADNLHYHEDCVEIRLDLGGLNDNFCDKKGKIVCEVELY
ncbi:C-type lectin domain family 4 member f isoform x1 [Plakobranchus ocellatus]|uniref:C-type lectin domain family 4 member f isoform x1 n=1 Tax=Plakobranchus ocellatus TaxID=259542 RepID=A0AAV4DH73_9GAST|nr:C-type lectin domain family 4 member f isoform x1 [Plakobranchus ocellatus]